MPTISQRITEFLIAWRWPMFLLALLGVAVALWPAGHLGFDRSIENMFAPDDPLLVPYQKLKRLFGGNEIVLAVYDDPHLMHPDGHGLDRLAAIAARLRKVPGIRDVLCLADVNQSLSQIDRVGNLLNLGRPSGPPILNQDSELARRFRKLFEGYTHGADDRTVAVACMLIPETETDVDRQQTIADLRAIVRELPEPLQPGMLVGEPVMVSEGFRELARDGERLGLTSTVLLALTILLCFRSVRWVIAPLVAVQVALVLTRALLVSAGLRLSMVSSMLTAIVTVVGIATMVLLIVGFRESRRKGLAPRAALARTGTLLGGPVFWSIMADVVGFGSLVVAAVGPVKDFGIMTATGSFVVMVSIALLLPVIALTGRFDADPKEAWGESRLDLGLGRMTQWVEQRPKTVGLVLLAFALLAAGGMLRLEVETDFTKNFRAESDVVKSYGYVETHLGGAGVWDVIVPVPPELDEATLGRVRALEDQLRQIASPAQFHDSGQPGLTKVLSLADADEAAQASALLAAMPVGARLLAMQTQMPVFIAALRSTRADENGQNYLRIMLRAPERQSAAQKQWLIAEVTRLSQQAFPASGSTPAAETTGSFVLLTNLIESISRDQWTTFAAAIAGIFLLMVVAFRSLTLALVALAPNALPIVMVIGLMGYLGYKINMGAAMIAAVSLGLSVRSSIHYISNFSRARSEGLSVSDALAAVQQTVGRAMFFSTIALIVGFSVLMLSEFVPTIYFGSLVSLAMIGGMLGNLLVLPLLLRMVK